MSLESPLTYAEWYWKYGLDERKAFDETTEKVLAPVYSRIFADIPELSQLPAGVIELSGLLSRPPSPGLGGFALGVGVETIDEILHTALAPMMSMVRRAINRRTKETWLKMDEATILAQRKKIQESYFYEIALSEGYENVVADFVYESKLPYPTIPEIISYARYHGNPDNPRDLVWERFDVSALDWDLWEWLSYLKLSTEQVQTLYKRKVLDEYNASMELARLGWHAVDRENVLDLSYSLPNAMLLLQGLLQQERDISEIIESISKADIHPNYVSSYIDGVLTKPSATDIIAFELRRDPLLSNLEKYLRKVGIHPEYWQVYKELAYPIPPVADIITMAVREAFTPEIAARFGQYEGLPSEFVNWVGKKGLSKEWAERYWAAHWSLPSPTQGFEMLHRGIITRDDLLLLLRALDIMPFWRDKLIEMAYRPLNRIDIRRMYQLGVLSESETKERYKHLGYDDRNAGLMTEFTVKQIRATLSRFTSSDVIKVFVKRFIEAGQARALLREIGIKDTEIDHIVNTAMYKREWSEKQERIDAIENLYKKGKYTEQQTRGELSRIGLPADHVQLLIEQWQLKVKAEIPATWTATQTLSFLRKGLITKERATQEFIALGYDAEHISVYLASVKPAP